MRAMKIMNTKKRLAGVLGVLMALCLLGTPVLADAPPEMNHQFYGEVTSEGELVDDGASVVAKVNGEPCGETTVALDEYGYNYNFDVLGTVASPGDLIEFYVDGVRAELYDAADEYQGTSYAFGGDDFRTELNLMLIVPDTTPPTVGITIADPVNLANVGAVAVTITSDEDGTYIYIISDGVIELTETDAIIADEPVELSLDLSTLADGPITADASVEDADGNLSKEIRWIDRYDENSADPNVWVDEPFSFTPAVNDVVHIMGTTYGGLRYRIMKNLNQSKKLKYSLIL